MKVLLLNCPVTKLPFVKYVPHPVLGVIPTYGDKKLSYSIPYKMNGIYFREVYDHLLGRWLPKEMLRTNQIVHDCLSK